MTDLLSFPKIIDKRGNLSFFENENQVPFTISRVYWIYDVPGGEKRGGHAFKTSHEVIVALSGSFSVVVDTGAQKTEYLLNRSYFGLYIPSMNWRSIENFSTNAVALVVSSTLFSESDYIRNIEEFYYYKQGLIQ